MPHTIVTDTETIEQIIQDAVEGVLMTRVPDALREAQKPEWMRPEQVEQRFGLTKRQLTYMRNNGNVEYTQRGRRILYKVESIEAWIEAGRVTPKNPPQDMNASSNEGTHTTNKKSPDRG
ncbi:MAG: helix-turn-helix domain-containing protein [Longimonas sp.]|uniref:helix-turn-helix domain-containing protein n=1 Tax=Longimonas sp. TaxID=2039626 RepID=UPI003346EF38